MKVCSFIPARGGSKSIDCKPLQYLGNPCQRLIDHTIQASVLATSIDETWISTEDQRIKDHVRTYWGSNANIHHRPESLAGDHSDIESAMEHFTNQNPYDLLILVQTTSPMTKYHHLNDAINLFISKMDVYDSAMSVYSMEKKDMLFWNCNGNFPAPMNYNPLKRGRRQERTTKHYVETGAFYITTRECFLEHKCRIGKKVMPIEMPYWESFEVDEPEDLVNIGKLLAWRD